MLEFPIFLAVKSVLSTIVVSYGDGNSKDIVPQGPHH